MVLLAFLSTPGSLTGQHTITIDEIIGDWSANLSGTQWDLLFEAHRQYSIWRVTAKGDTLVLSMGVWDLDGIRICIIPIGRAALCDTVQMDNPHDRNMTEWHFQAETGFGWVAYRRGYAPWDSGMPWRDRDVFQLSDVAIKPQVLGCTEPLVRPPEFKGQLVILTRFIVEPDSTVTGVEVIDAPTEAAHTAAERVATSCRVAPGALANGRVVRVKVELRLRFP